MLGSTLSENDLVTLRRAAAMAHGVGAIGLTLLAGSVPKARVAPNRERTKFESCPTLLVVDPCGFRMAVAKAWGEQRAGRRTQPNARDPDRPLDVEWSVLHPGEVIGFGAVRAPCGGRTVWAFASLLTPEELRPVLSDFDGNGAASTTIGHRPPSFPSGPDVNARLVHDELLHTTLVYIEADRPDLATVRRLDALLVSVLAVCAAAEIAVSSSTPARRSSER